MARPARWKKEKAVAGVMNVKLSSWKYFSDFVNQELLDYTTYVFRGHGNSTWKLEPTLDRVIKDPESAKREEHLEAFKYAARGRRGSNPPSMTNDNDWWALGQHHGLHTPLLDWTESPFVALYFAANSAFQSKSKNYSVYSLAQSGVELLNMKIVNDDEEILINNRRPTVNLVKPLSDENNRLVSQRGMFSRGPNNLDLDMWVRYYCVKYFPKLYKAYLVKITVPNTGSKECLRYLNRMNINSATLFPDLGGATEYCNKNITIPKY